MHKRRAAAASVQGSRLSVTKMLRCGELLDRSRCFHVFYSLYLGNILVKIKECLPDCAHP